MTEGNVVSLKELANAFKSIDRFGKENDINVLDNYNFRTQGIKLLLDKFEIFEELKISPGRTGKDAFSKNYENIEIKTKTTKTKTITKNSAHLEFDKQNDEVRQRQTLEYDAFVVGGFIGANLLPNSLFVFKTRNSISLIGKIIREEQEKKIKSFEEKIKLGKRIGRDSVSFSVKKVMDGISKEEDVIIFINGERITLDDYNKVGSFKIQELEIEKFIDD